MQAVLSTVENLVDQIVAVVHPTRIILFGSAARGDARPESDIDLLIVMPEGTDSRAITRLLYRKVDVVEKDFDLLVTTPDILEKYRDNCALVYKWALQEGREVYAA